MQRLGDNPARPETLRGRLYLSSLQRDGVTFRVNDDRHGAPCSAGTNPWPQAEAQAPARGVMRPRMVVPMKRTGTFGRR